MGACFFLNKYFPQSSGFGCLLSYIILHFIEMDSFSSTTWSPYLQPWQCYGFPRLGSVNNIQFFSPNMQNVPEVLLRQKKGFLVGLLLLCWSTMNFRQKEFILFILLGNSPSLQEVRTWIQTGQEPASTVWYRGYGGVPLSGLFLIAFSTYILTEFRTTIPGWIYRQ